MICLFKAQKSMLSMKMKQLSMKIVSCYETKLTLNVLSAFEFIYFPVYFVGLFGARGTIWKWGL